MAISLQRTGGVHAGGVKVLVYGQAGAGKTYLASTVPTPVILSAEAGLLSIRDFDLPYLKISSIQDLHQAAEWIGSSEAANFETVVVDSLSEIAEVVLADEKLRCKDPRQAYGIMQDTMAQIIRMFRNLPRHVYMTAKVERQKDELDRIFYYPCIPGNKASQALPYFFDEVFALRCERGEEGAMVRTLQTETDGLWLAKDRSGKLAPWEEPDLGVIFNKIIGGQDENG